MSELKRSKSDPSKSRGFGSINTRTEKPPRIEDLIDVVKYPKKKWLEVRFVGDVWSYAHWWIDIETAKGPISIPKQCLNYDPETDSFDSTIVDPYEDIPNNKRRGTRYYCNAIIRDAQQEEPRKKPPMTSAEKKTGFKDMKSKSWTPISAVPIPSSLAAKLQSLKELNRHKSKKGVASYEISHPKYGCNVFIKFDPSVQGTDMYQVNKGDSSPLTEDELNLLRYNLEGLLVPESLEVAKREAANLSTKAADKEEEEEEDDDDFEDKPKKSKKSTKSSSKDKSKTTKSSSKTTVKPKKSKSPDKSSKTKSKDKTKSRTPEKSKSSTKSKSKDKKKRSRDFD